jgi:hypothetical protein
MKGWLSKTTLAAMKLSLARQQPFAQETLRALESAPLHEALVMRDQHVLDVVRVVEKEDFLRTEAEVHDVAVLLRGLLQVAQSVAPEGSEIAAEQTALRTWRMS